MAGFNDLDKVAKIKTKEDVMYDQIKGRERYTKVFVYGALEQGEHLNHLVNKFEHMGKSNANGLFGYYIYRNFPLLCKSSRKIFISGDLYRLSIKALRELDKEMVYGDFVREKINTDAGAAWAYVWDGDIGFMTDDESFKAINQYKNVKAQWVEDQLEALEE